MGQTETPGGLADHRVEPPVEAATAPDLSTTVGISPGRRRGRHTGSLVAGIIACVFAAAALAGGGWALWKDRVDRDSAGLVSFGTTDLSTETYAIVGDTHGDGPDWLWGSDVLGDTRVRATSKSDQPLFIGIARTGALFGYLRGAGYATVESFEVTADTTHPGDAPSGPPSSESIWTASTQGTGEQTLKWKPRSGDWSVVFMNADAGAGVAVHGDLSAELPILPWVAGALLVLAALLGGLGAWFVVRAFRREE